ncbi:MAG: FAD-dependent oxidoreductase, partial [Tenericutes bacterium]|nr:FAD-dependent oxidoreductase [Mycoplasmatota bacterium]
MFDYLIIGAGIVGASIARVLSKYKLDVLVLEKESDVANYQTIANSAIIHSGHDPEPNTLKSKLCVQGNRMYETLAKELSFPLDFYGGIVLAFSTDEVEQLHQ